MAHPLEPDQVRDERPVGNQDRSLGELFSELTRETTTLVRREVDLAKTEMSHKLAEVGRDIGFLAAGGAGLYGGLLALLAALMIGLGQAGVTWWLSGLIVRVAVLALGGFLVWSGLNNLKHTTVAPQETIE